MEPPRKIPSPTRGAQRARARSVVALCRARLASTRAGRWGRTVATLAAAGFGLVAIGLRISDGAEASLSGLTLTAAPWIAWIAGGALAWAAAEDRAAVDRREGVEALAAAHGVSPSGLEAARVLAAMSAVAASIGVPLGLLALLTAALAGRASVALHRAGVAIGVAMFAIVVGVTLGGVGAACGRLGRERGRWLLFTVIAVPWMLADLTGHPGWSIPGALGAVLDFALGARGVLA